MSTSTTHQQSLADVGSETRPPMLERGLYEFHMFTPKDDTVQRMQTEDDLRGDEMKYYEAEIEVVNLILISIPNDIYNSEDACTTAKEMWNTVERLVRGTIQNKVDRETRFHNEFDKFAAEPGEALVSVNNRFAQLMNDLERNDINFPPVTINTKFLNCLQPEWLKYVTQVRLAKRLTEDSFDNLFDYLQQFEKLKYNPYYVTNPSSMVDYDDNYQKDVVQYNSEDPLTSAIMLLSHAINQQFSNPTNNRLRTSSNTRNQAIVQGDRINIQRRNSSNNGRNTRRAYVQDEVVEGNNVLNDDSKMEEIEELSANICLMARIQPSNTNFDEEPRYDSAFLNEVQSTSTSFENPLYDTNDQEQTYPTQPKIINDSFGDDQINSNIIFDEPNRNVNSGSVENDKGVFNSYYLEQLARNAYKEAEKQQVFAKKVQHQNTMLTNQLELYKEKVRVLEKTNGDTMNYFNEYIEADRKAKHFDKEAQSQFSRDRDIIRDLEQQRHKMDLIVIELRKKNEELQKTQTILKRKISDNEDNYNDTILDLEAKLKKNVDLMLKLGNSLQGMFMLGPKPLSVYDPKLRHGLGLDYFWISNMEKLEGENVSLEFKVQSLVKERENLKLEYQKLFDSTKQTRSQTQEEINKLIEHVNQKTYAYADVRAKNQDLLITISELKARFKNVKKGLKVESSVRRPMNRISQVKNSVFANTKKSRKKVEVYVKKNKTEDIASENVVSNT
ncbi:hypothetical protein Tco_0943890 [Tanacetum coccineum]